MAAIDTCHQNGEAVDEARWVAVLRGREREVCDWLSTTISLSLKTALLGAVLFGPSDENVAMLGHGFLHEQLRGAKGDGAPSPTYLEFAAFCLAVALNDGGDDARELIAEAFEPVHDAAMSSALSWRSWHWLAPSMPRPSWYSLFDWDRAEKLRRALVDRFLRYRWDPKALGGAVSSPDTRWRLASYCRESREGRELLRASGLK